VLFGGVTFLTMLANVSTQLGDLHLALQLPLEAREQDFPLTRLEAIEHVAQRALRKSGLGVGFVARFARRSLTWLS